MPLLFLNIISSYTHPSIPSDYDVEDAFSSTNAPNYILTPPGYSPVTPGNISPDTLDNLTKDVLSSLSISPFHDNPYMKVVQAYDAIPPPQVIIALPAIVPPSMFDSRDFFPPEEISLPKDTETLVESPILVSLSSSVGSLSPVRSTTSPPDYPLISYLSGRVMPSKRTSTSAAPAMTQAAIRQLVADSVATALKAQAATMANTNRNTGTIGTPVARKGTNNHKRNFDDRRNITTNNDNNNYLNNHNNHPNDHNNNNYSNNRNNNNYRDNQNNHNRNNDYHQQQNRRQETIRTYAATLTENKRCQTCNKVGHQTRNCRSKGPATGSNLRLVSVTFHACGEKGHYKSQCSKTDNSTFHVSKKSLCDESLVIPMKEIWLDDKLNYMEEPVEIMDREVKQLRQRCIPIIKVRWNSEFT
ncbi:putative reverse transcriptase domain-containing protein [Tanacetum coccineum]|uniref:Reverse transcriptase domain-containing protein n=1 Tax=Tanacetum coccineum TaxID=301880 RepID=A0ABQ5JAH1_9ASTR